MTQLSKRSPKYPICGFCLNGFHGKCAHEKWDLPCLCGESDHNLSKRRKTFKEQL